MKLRDHSCARRMLALVLCGASTLAGAESTTLLSATAQGTPGNNASDHPAISADGRYVVFDSEATNLVSGDTNGFKDIFLLDRQSNALSIVSRSSSGQEANNYSDWPTISGNGRHVAFVSTASNLVGTDTNGASDIFVVDRNTATLTRVSVGTGGVQADGNSLKAVLSYDGRYVAFVSYASNLVSGDTNYVSDVFVHDRDPDANGSFDGNGTTARVSVDTGGVQRTLASDHPSISADGRYVAYVSGNEVYVYDRTLATTQRLSVGTGGAASNGLSRFTTMSADGRYIAFMSDATNLVANDTNGVGDVFVADRTTGVVVRGNLSNSDAQVATASNFPVLSADGRYLLFLSETTAFSSRPSAERVYLDAVSAATGSTGGGGTTVTAHAYRRDLVAGITVRVSSSSSGTAANASTSSLGINSDGSLVVFGSAAANLACVTDGNNLSDVFLRNFGASDSCSGSTAPASSKAASGDVPILVALALLLGLLGFAHRRENQ